MGTKQLQGMESKARCWQVIITFPPIIGKSLCFQCKNIFFSRSHTSVHFCEYVRDIVQPYVKVTSQQWQPSSGTNRSKFSPPTLSVISLPTASLTRPLSRICTDGTHWNTSMQLEEQQGGKQLCVCVCF